MNSKDLKKIKGVQISELYKTLAKKKQEAALTSVKMAAGKEKNLKSYKSLKKDIAQLLTIITEKEIVKQSDNKDDELDK